MTKTLFNFEEIVLSSEVDADAVLEAMRSRLSQRGAVILTDYYDFLGLTSRFTDTKWRWTNLDDAKVVEVQSGFNILLPDPEYTP
jgi:hypothetical protein